MGCLYDGEEYSEGAEICRFGSLLRCRNDGWVAVGTCAASGEAPILPVLSMVSRYVNKSPEEASAFKADPTGYLSARLEDVGIPIPDGFHAHYVDTDGGDLSPPEDAEIPEGREVFEISDGQVSLVEQRGIRAACQRCYGICIVLPL
ncbi:hypothetical protein [Jannaschia sp. LMIT008]|uniref:hypothetical protein n=1 Tax=Jannaschia maritima TaxID=3032585 RepID=UPI002811B86B|nr:hypothetical protein [Jannaschia sp. LMIT008]